MRIEMRITRMEGPSSHQPSPHGEVSIQQGTVMNISMPRKAGKYATDIGTVTVSKVTRDRRVMIGGSLVGQEVTVPINRRTRTGRVDVSPGKSIDVYVSKRRRNAGNT